MTNITVITTKKKCTVPPTLWSDIRAGQAFHGQVWDTTGYFVKLQVSTGVCLAFNLKLDSHTIGGLDNRWRDQPPDAVRDYRPVDLNIEIIDNG